MLNADIRTAARCLNQKGVYNSIQVMASEMEVFKPKIDDQINRQVIRLLNYKQITIRNLPGASFTSLYLKNSFEELNENPEYLFNATIYDLVFFFLLNDESP